MGEMKNVVDPVKADSELSGRVKIMRRRAGNRSLLQEVKKRIAALL